MCTSNGASRKREKIAFRVDVEKRRRDQTHAAHLYIHIHPAQHLCDRTRRSVGRRRMSDKLGFY